MKNVKLGILLVALLIIGAQAQAKPISPQPGEGKYRFCQRMYDGCMKGVFGKVGSQSYNVGQAKCRGKWNSCRKSGTWNVAIGFHQAFDSPYFYEKGADVEVDLTSDEELDFE